MKLSNVVNSIESWRKVSELKMSPQLAYTILKYMKLVSSEYDIAEKQRVSLIYRITGKKPGEQASIEPNTTEFMQYVTEFSHIIDTDIELNKIDLTLDNIVSSISKDQENVLTVKDLNLLEPFFND